MDYRVYLHVFPDGKKYVGCTKMKLKARWAGGMGYENQNAMFGAICKFGWNNVRHYLLFDGLDKNTALLIEASLIEKWKTYRKGRGYNAVRPKLPDMNLSEVPKFKKTPVEDMRELTVEEAYAKRNNKRKMGKHKAPAHPVRNVTKGESFDSISEAANSVMVSVVTLWQYLKNYSDNPRSRCAGCMWEYIGSEK